MFCTTACSSQLAPYKPILSITAACDVIWHHHDIISSWQSNMRSKWTYTDPQYKVCCNFLQPNMFTTQWSHDGCQLASIGRVLSSVSYVDVTHVIWEHKVLSLCTLCWFGMSIFGTTSSCSSLCTSHRHPIFMHQHHMWAKSALADSPSARGQRMCGVSSFLVLQLNWGREDVIVDAHSLPTSGGVFVNESNSIAS